MVTSNYRDFPLISILVPVYNCEAYLNQCISSIIDQDYTNLQIVIANDGSTDGSLEICRKYESQDSRIKVLTRENKGVATTRNDLLDQIEGDYFLFVDADDWIEPNMVSYLFYLMKDNSAQIAVCAKSNNNSIPQQDSNIKVWDRKDVIKKFLYHKEISGSLWNKLINSSLIQRNRFNPEIYYGEDALFLWKLLYNIDKLAVSNMPLYHQTSNPYSLSNREWTPEKKGTGHKVWESILSDVDKDWPEFSNIAKSSLAINDMWMIYYASKANHPCDSYISTCQNSIKRNFKYINQLKVLNLSHRLYALVVSRSYFLSKFICKFI